MSEGKDNDQDFEESKAQAPPRRPRREREQKEEKKELESVDTHDMTQQMQPVETGKPGRRKRGQGGEEGGGWMSNEASGGAGGGRKLSVDDADTAMTLNKNKHKEEDDELILIPDLEDGGMDEDKRVAHAPKNIHRRIPTMTELSNDVKTVISSNELGYDLGVLLNALVPAEFLNEQDSLWTFDSLLQEVTEEFQKNDKLVLSEALPSQ
jgi:hypothetical protein